MARITVEDCLEQESNRFALVLLAAKRTKQLLHGADPIIENKRDNKSVVTSLREIATGKVRFKTEEDLALEQEEEMKAREQEELANAVSPALMDGGSNEGDASDDGSSEASSSETSENGAGTINPF